MAGCPGSDCPADVTSVDLVAPPPSIIGCMPDVSATGTFTPTGLSIAGRVTEVNIDNVSWTALPAAPLANRNAMSIQNDSGQEIKLNYDPLVAGYIGMIIPDQGVKGYDIRDTIVIYAKSSTSVCKVTVEELS